MSAPGVPQFGEADLSNCDREPIHVPGSIQPHGALIAFTEPELIVVQVSESVSAHLERSAGDVLLRSVDDLLGPEQAAVVRERYIARESFSDVNPVAIQVAAPGGGTRSFDGVLHRTSGLLVLEIEPAPARGPEQVDTFMRRARSSMRDLEQASTARDVLQLAAQRVRELTGFDRVMVYRFSRDWHGEVIAEARRDDLEPFLGLHFPASDIPKQARDLYARSSLRLIPDVAYTPSRLVPRENPGTGAPLDLSFSVLRSVSPVHLEYLRNMGVAASMSISLMKAGQLWGLIACHHATPHHLSYEVRMACEFLGQVLSVQLATKVDADEVQRRLEKKGVQTRLIEAMSAKTSVLDGLLDSEELFVGFAGATGGAVHYEGVLRAVGAVPPEPDVRAIIELLATSGAAPTFATEHLAGMYPPAERFKDLASGLLAVTLSQEHRDCILWFRPEALRTVTWSGDPSKPVEADEQGVRLTPRKSFAAWKETVRLRSTPWDLADVEAAQDLRAAILTVIVRRAAELKRLNIDLGEAVRARDDFLSVASHELRTPLSALQLQFQMLLREPASLGALPVESLRAKLELSQRQIKQLTQLVGSLLDVARVRGGRLALDLEEGVDLGALVRDVLPRMAAERERARSGLEVRVAEGVKGRWDPLRLDQVVTNLVSNAIKYGNGKTITVLVTSDGRAARLVVRDEGIGITPDDQARLFHQFERAVVEHDYVGLGLGLWITKQIVTRHGGDIAVESAPGRGSTFTVILPLAGPPA